jgi:hypothetical protein
MTTSAEVQQLGEPLSQEEAIASLGRYGYGWADSDIAGASAQRGLSDAVVRDISAKKNEPEWMLENRLKALRIFGRKPMPKWGSNLEGIDFDNIKYFVRSTEKQAATWDDLPEDIRNTYDKLGIPEAEKQRLVAGVAAQYECLAGDTLVWTANRGQSRKSSSAIGFLLTTRVLNDSWLRRSRLQRRPTPDSPMRSRRRGAASARPTTTRCWYCVTSASKVGSARGTHVAGSPSASSSRVTSSRCPARFPSSVWPLNFPA